jgi:hypothetical protein
VTGIKRQKIMPSCDLKCIPATRVGPDQRESNFGGRSLLEEETALGIKCEHAECAMQNGYKI